MRLFLFSDVCWAISSMMMNRAFHSRIWNFPPNKTYTSLLLMLTGRFLSCLAFCIFAFLRLLVEYFEYLIELQIFAGIVVGMFVVILCCSKFFYDLQVTTSKCRYVLLDTLQTNSKYMPNILPQVFCRRRNIKRNLKGEKHLLLYLFF